MFMVSDCRGCGLGVEVGKLRGENGRLVEENRRLREEVRALRLEVLGLKPARKKRDSDVAVVKSKSKKLGPPFGHVGASRSRPARVDERVVLRLGSCPRCNGSDLVSLSPRYRYVEDIVPVELRVTEFEINQYYCRGCGRVVYPEVPDVAGNSRFGVRFLLYVTYLRYVLNLPYNKIAMAPRRCLQGGCE